MTDNVLGTLFGDIANAIRSKTGDTAKMKPIDFPTKILEIEVGGATETDIIPEQEFALTLNSQLGVYMASGFDLFSLKSGEKYYVVWGEETFTCTAVDGVFEGAPCVAIGNPYPVGGTNNNLPFVIGCVPNFQGHTLCLIVALAEQTETKKVRVYQKAGGGSGDAVVWFVTFIGADGTELYRMPVLDGDDCKDPYTRGDIEKPTKESTAQYNYTYSGWSLTDGGSANANALKAVTEDKTVYAAFEETARTYTIMYYDDDGTFLSSQTLAYGATPSYTPEKGGYTFTGWIPEISSVVGDASYTATWIQQVDFATSPWSYIAEISESGMADKVFKKGDKKPFSFTYNGTTYNINAEIIAFNHDDQEDGSKVGMTLCCDVSLDSVELNASGSTKTYGGKTSSYAGGYPLCDFRTTLNNVIYNALPDDMRSAIKTVIKPTNEPVTNVIQNCNDKLWLFSGTEVGGTVYSTISSKYKLKVEGSRYSGFSLQRNRYDGTEFGASNNMWLRSGLTDDFTNGAQYTKRSGSVCIYHTAPSGVGFLLFGFCI